MFIFNTGLVEQNKADKVAMDEYIKARSGESDFTRECADDEIEAKVKDYGFELLPTTQAPPTNKDSPTTDAQPSTSTSIFPHSFKALKRNWIQLSFSATHY